MDTALERRNRLVRGARSNDAAMLKFLKRVDKGHAQGCEAYGPRCAPRSGLELASEAVLKAIPRNLTDVLDAARTCIEASKTQIAALKFEAAEQKRLAKGNLTQHKQEFAALHLQKKEQEREIEEDKLEDEAEMGESEGMVDEAEGAVRAFKRMKIDHGSEDEDEDDGEWETV
ncbi:uncharacterized protein BDZ99DRAFT_527228 [Mytilinidion resinicola]|uniref:Uncharacterized protein n=1 Tax=Mytilinidion resinicola TaxID=574789 RepID=A0A6A6Y3J1_9PEZI|nr:uncharacterized protein BDZ99DRAFT_527228 [Mytilinidion resinicola]KAF2802795.1 hypothetical protein BDZ99DRAFT_527228 [Mytilinidion resinicola]